MCLFTLQKEPYIAKRDITVLKALKRDGDDFVTPIMQYPVEFNKILSLLDEDDDFNESGFFDYGYFHAYPYFKQGCHTSAKEWLYFRAIIPKGTEYYINEKLNEVGARKMIITDEVVNAQPYSSKVGWQDTFDLFEPMFEGVSHDEVEKGWVLGDDDCLYHPFSLSVNKGLQGIVCSRPYYKGTEREQCQVLFMHGCKHRFVYVKRKRNTMVDWLTNRKRLVCTDSID